MTGHVPHANRDDLHGLTVVVDAADGRTMVGRWHEHGPKGVILRDVAVFDPKDAAVPIEEWFGKLRKFGVPASFKHLVLPTDQFKGVRRLAE